jgi:hypothetical protein
MSATVAARWTSHRTSGLATGLLLLASAVSAQEPLLRASAKAPQWIAGLAEALAVQLPPLAAGQRLELLVDAEGAASASAVVAPDGLAGERLLQLELRPAAWLAHAELPRDAAPRSARNRAVAIGQLLGLTPRQSGALAEALWARLHELERCELGVTAGDGDRPARLELLATPRPASELANWLSLLRPAERQAPTWAWPRALLQVRLQLAPTDLAAAAAPLLPWWSAIAGEPADVLTERLASHDGRLAFVVDEAQWGLVMGLRDVDSFAARWRADGSTNGPDDDTPTTRQPAAPYRDVALLRTRHRGRQPIPRYGDDEGTVEAFGGIVGTHWVQVAGQKAREGAERAIDDALAGRLLGSAERRASEPAPTGWLSLDLDVQALQAQWNGEAERAMAVRRVHLECATDRTTNGAPRLRVLAAWR